MFHTNTSSTDAPKALIIRVKSYGRCARDAEVDCHASVVNGSNFVSAMTQFELM